MSGQATAVRKNILLVDDQQEVREVIRVLLDLDEHTVTEAGNGQEALAQFRPGAFDLVITDFKMPLMSGHELATNLRQLAPAQRILMVTGSATQTGFSAESVDAVLNKPFRLEDLRRAIADVLVA
jgi:CheY-like chemotaxis protein